MWDELDFPSEHKEKLLIKQLKEDKTWNDISAFLNLIELLIKAVELKTLSSNHLIHKFEWWGRYFDFDTRNSNKDSFFRDLKSIETFLIDSRIKGELKTAFYVQ